MFIIYCIIGVIYSNIMYTFVKQFKDNNISFDDLKTELYKVDKDGCRVYNLNVKENDDLALIYYSDQRHDELPGTPLEQSCKSYILEKATLDPIATQFNKIIYNEDAIEFLEDKKWSDVIVQKCYEGTMLLVFYHKDKWYVTTRRCLDASDSIWIKGRSYLDMFNEATKGKLNFDNLNKNYCYHFILVHYKNKNIVTYNRFGPEYKKIFHSMTSEKHTLKIINVDVPGIDKIPVEHFRNLKSILKELSFMSIKDENYRKITEEGFILRYGDSSNFIIMKLQTPIYQKIKKMKPNNSNVNQIYLELYQKDSLSVYLPYFTKFTGNITNRIHNAMKHLSKEVMDLYHCTRQKKNPQIYEQLPNSYKQVLYNLHRLYIEFRKPDFKDRETNHNLESIQELKTQHPRSINIHDVYYYLKSLPPKNLRQLFFDRIAMLKNENNLFLIQKCISINTQTALMFS